MYSGFPLNQLPLLRCLHDGSELEVAEAAAGVPGERLVEGALRCTRCGARFPVQDGVVRMLDADALDAESRHEWRKRDEEAASYHEFVADPVTNEMEMRPTFAALRLDGESVCFELGCGTGRYTLRLAAECRALLAVDFSGESLLVLARKLDAAAPVGLVQADVARLRLAPRAFHQGLSTLVSNLPTRAVRDAMYRLAAEALRPEGRFVFGTHHHGLRQRLRGEPKEGAYTAGGIYRYCFGMREIAAEVRPYYGQVSVLPVQIPVPLGQRLGLPVARLSQLLGRVPLVNQWGNLLLVTASRPVAPPAGARARSAQAQAQPAGR